MIKIINEILRLISLHESINFVTMNGKNKAIFETVDNECYEININKIPEKYKPAFIDELKNIEEI